MIDFLIFILISSLWCLGVYNARDLILYTPSAWIDLNLPSWLAKPLISCVYCMASIHTVIVFAIGVIGGLINFSPILVLIAIPCVSYLNGILFTLVFDKE